MKGLKTVLVSLVILVLLFLPFFMPDRWMYIEKCESVYDSTWEGWATVTTWFWGLFVGIGVFTTVEKLFKNKTED